MDKINRRKPKSGKVSYGKIPESNDAKFNAPKPGIENILFAPGSSKDAAKFNTTKKNWQGT